MDRFTKNEVEAFWTTGILLTACAAFFIWMANKRGGVIQKLERQIHLQKLFEGFEL